MSFLYGALLVVFVCFVYWFAMVFQGVYFGRRFVCFVYDMGASVYDAVKRNNPEEETTYLGAPVSERIVPDARLLDVAVGTARLPLALVAMPSYRGKIVGLDISRKMLAEAARKVAPYRERIALVHHPSIPLPFANESFDAVTCIEALELMPRWRLALEEMVRVLCPGGWLAVTNRIGPTAKMMPGQVVSTERFIAFLASLGLVKVASHPWRKYYFGQLYYELILAQKPGPALSGQSHSAWPIALMCPQCGALGNGVLKADGCGWGCQICGKTVQIEEDGVWKVQ